MQSQTRPLLEEDDPPFQYEIQLCGGKVQGLAGAYMVAGESGHISARGVSLLLRLWKELDPHQFCTQKQNFLLVKPVAEAIQKNLEITNEEFEKSVCLPVVAPLLCPWLCPSSSVSPEDVAHALNDLELPKDSAAMMISRALSAVFPLGDSARCLTAFLLKAVMNYPFQLHTVLLHGLPVYGAVLVIRFVPALTSIWVLYRFLYFLVCCVGALMKDPQNELIREVAWQTMSLAVWVWFADTVWKYRRVMTQHLPMLIVRCHRSLREHGLLTEEDFLPWKKRQDLTNPPTTDREQECFPKVKAVV